MRGVIKVGQKVLFVSQILDFVSRKIPVEATVARLCERLSIPFLVTRACIRLSFCSDFESANEEEYEKCCINNENSYYLSLCL